MEMYSSSGLGSSKKQVNPLATVTSTMTTGVVALSPADSFAKSVDIMAKGGFRHLVITDEKYRVIGVLSDRDILRSRGRISEWGLLKVQQVMTINPLCVAPQTLLPEDVSMMISKRINCLPVVDDEGKLLGLVTSTDLLRSFQNILETMQAQTC
jgi:CBS domain-containing protein